MSGYVYILIFEKLYTYTYIHENIHIPTHIWAWLTIHELFALTVKNMAKLNKANGVLKYKLYGSKVIEK
jgi:hypothetical protein